jgi:hypothetical protein
VHQQIGNPKNGDRHDHWQIVPVPPGDDLARGNGDQNGRALKPDGPVCQTVTDRRAAPGATADRKPPGPVRNGGQQEPGKRRDHEAEQHLVDVPTERIKTAGHRRAGREHDNPNRQRNHRPDPSRQEERPEPLGQHRRSATRGRSVGGDAHDAPLRTRDNDPLCTLHQPGAIRANETRDETQVLTTRAVASSGISVKAVDRASAAVALPVPTNTRTQRQLARPGRTASNGGDGHEAAARGAHYRDSPDNVRMLSRGMSAKRTIRPLFASAKPRSAECSWSGMASPVCVPLRRSLPITWKA